MFRSNARGDMVCPLCDAGTVRTMSRRPAGRTLNGVGCTTSWPIHADLTVGPYYLDRPSNAFDDNRRSLGKHLHEA